MKADQQQIKGIFIAALMVLSLSAFTYADTVYVCTTAGAARYSPSGEYLGAVSNSIPGISSVAFDNGGNLWATQEVSFPYAGKILKFDSSGNATTIASTGTEVQPQGIRFDSSGNAYVVYPSLRIDARTVGVIEKFDSSGHDLGAFVSGLDDGKHRMVFDGGGNLYLSGSTGIREYSSSGTYLGLFNKSYFSGGGITSLAFDNSGNLWAANKSAANKIDVLKFDSAGNSSIFASLDSLGTPQGMAFDSSGNLYLNNVAYGGSQLLSSISKFDSNGNQSVFWSYTGSMHSLDIAIQTPEPATMLLLGLGGMMLRRKGKQ